ncbi:sulfite exporter TauE/SafE family protein [Candidatus Uhrbacteria bacterium]|nr:sulfite exporter TauE/SafE family protein [Candidatus Uhrbacteria bacterium]
MSHEQRFCVAGTTCHSCEIVLERELKKLPGVLDVRASHAGSCVDLVLAKDSSFTPDDLARQMSGSKYRFSSWQDAQAHNGWNLKRTGGILLVALAIWYVLNQLGLLTVSPTVNAAGGLITFFVIGLIASVSSCTAVLSGLIVALSANHAKTHATESAHDRLRPHILFNLGRLIGFGVFGFAIGAVGSVLSLSPGLNALFVVVIALLMLGLGANLLDLVPPGAFALRPPKALAHAIHRLQDSHHPAVPFVLGALTFFLPCGFTQSVQLYALSTGSPLTAAAIMIVFALGTMPALLGLGAATSIAHGRRLKQITQVAGVLVLVIGFAQLLNGFTLLGVASPGSVTKEKLAVAQDALLLVDGKQIIQMEVGGGFYVPDVLQVVEDIPVEWEIYGPSFMGCAETLVSRGLGINARLKPGDNTVRFTPKEPGEYVFSCSMGMVRGTMIVVEKPL